ncbi:MAG: DegT/DnrJ/EryC1/StrS family aminotransferase [Flavobacteriales bacterium]|nr:DegT/DnrJ/EryC1/StrS family aminotransferase [Flavobacteriales bacterium]MCB0778055.1 DegT/DnrJ/EryC1/StrS family aminotransferase [Flavobacteriales bacterium]MCB0807667.1 DegT/DnrJ/EryC1/StrS family aminotransferase [Flavobacteriales bacterium]
MSSIKPEPVVDADTSSPLRGPVPVTKPFMPPFEEFIEVMRGVWDRGWVTNNGPLVAEFEKALEERFGIQGPVFVANGTLALHLAIRALDLKGEIITTAFTHPVTTISIIWEGCTPVFVDIDPETFNIDPARIEERITPRTSAILATHVYGVPCDVEAIQAIADRHGLKVIYDGAHAFGTTYKGRNILNWGDISTTSFHATKIFQTVEGGSLHTKDPVLLEKLRRMRQMGQWGESFELMGINAKNSEFHAAMGIANLPHYEEIMARRKTQWAHYARVLDGLPVQLIRVDDSDGYNHSYFPVVFRDQLSMMSVREALDAIDIHPRRYFSPATTELPYVQLDGTCPTAENLASRVLCLPMYHELQEGVPDEVAGVIADVLSS